MGAATIRLVPMAIVSFGTYELVRSLLLSLEEQVRGGQQQQQGEVTSGFRATDAMRGCMPQVDPAINGMAQPGVWAVEAPSVHLVIAQALHTRFYFAHTHSPALTHRLRGQRLRRSTA